MEDKRFFIPNNYLDSGYVLNGMFSFRNAIEAVVLFFISYQVCEMLPITHGWDGITNYILICGPITLIGAAGIQGDPLSQYFMDIYRWRKRKKPYFYNSNGKAYHLSAADLMEESPGFREMLAGKLDQIRASMRSPVVEYVEGENYQFASDPELEALQAAEERRFQTTETEEQTVQEEQTPVSASAAELNVDDILSNIKLNDFGDGGADFE